MSEVARIREQIDLEMEAMRRALYGPAIVARHDFITHKMEILWGYKEQLDQHMQSDDAARIIIGALDTLDRAPEVQQ